MTVFEAQQQREQLPAFLFITRAGKREGKKGEKGREHARTFTSLPPYFPRCATFLITIEESELLVQHGRFLTRMHVCLCLCLQRTSFFVVSFLTTYSSVFSFFFLFVRRCFKMRRRRKCLRFIGFYFVCLLIFHRLFFFLLLHHLTSSLLFFSSVYYTSVSVVMAAKCGDGSEVC